MNRLFTITIVLMYALLFVACGPEPRGPSGPVGNASGSAPHDPPTALEQVLRQIPDIPESRQTLAVSDIEKIRTNLGINAPDDQATSDQVLEYLIEMITRAYETGGVRLTRNLGTGQAETWLSGFVRANSDPFDTTYDSLGFDSRNVDQIASFGGPEPLYREVLLGSFDAEETADNLGACAECEPHDLVMHSGTEYYAWDADYKQSLSMRFAKPAFDGLGRGGRIWVRDGMASRTLSSEHMEQIIDAATGAKPSLADDSAYVLAAKTLAKYDVVAASFSSVQSTVESAIKQMEDFWDSGLPKVLTTEELEEQFAEAHLLLPFNVTAVGTAFPESEGEPTVTYAVMVHSTDEDASQNAGRLKQRIEMDEFLIGSNIPNGRGNLANESLTWAEHLPDYEIILNGQVVVLILSAEIQWQILNWTPNDPTSIHNLLITE